MKTYKIRFVFNDNINIETNYDSDLNLNDFVGWFNQKYQTETFLNLIGGSIKMMINVRNILFYTIQEVKE